MKTSTFSVFLVILFAVFFATTFSVFAQDEKPRPSPKASVSQTIGLDTEITINYGRPAVRGRDIYWEVVPNGMEEPNDYSDNKPYPWRAGANENTTIEFNSDLKINGNAILKGKYSICMIPSDNEWTVIFNKVNDGWGCYKYDQSQDALRVGIAAVKADFAEWLTFGFEDMVDFSATAYLHWGEKKIPFQVEVAGK
jgi:hypothetical protein